MDHGSLQDPLNNSKSVSEALPGLQLEQFGGRDARCCSKWLECHTCEIPWLRATPSLDENIPDCNEFVQGKTMSEPTSALGYAMQLWIHCLSSVHLQDMWRGVWQDIAEQLKDVTLNQKQLVKESMIMPPTCQTSAATISIQSWYSGNAHYTMR